MVIVTAKKNESFERLLRRFTRKVDKSGLFFDLKEKEYYIKPSALKRERRQAKKRFFSSTFSKKIRKN